MYENKKTKTRKQKQDKKVREDENCNETRHAKMPSDPEIEKDREKGRIVRRNFISFSQLSNIYFLQTYSLINFIPQSV